MQNVAPEFYICHKRVLLTLVLFSHHEIIKFAYSWALQHGCLSLLAVLLLCGFLRAQQQLLPGSCNFELGTCGYTSDPEYGSWSMNEEGTVSPIEINVLWVDYCSITQAAIEILKSTCKSGIEPGQYIEKFEMYAHPGRSNLRMFMNFCWYFLL